MKHVGIVGEVRRTRFGWVRLQSAAEVVCWAVVRTCRRLVSTGRIYRVAWNEVKVPLSVVERSVCASPVAVLVCATLPQGESRDLLTSGNVSFDLPTERVAGRIKGSAYSPCNRRQRC